MFRSADAKPYMASPSPCSRSSSARPMKPVLPSTTTGPGKAALIGSILHRRIGSTNPDADWSVWSESLDAIEGWYLMQSILALLARGLGSRQQRP